MGKSAAVKARASYLSLTQPFRTARLSQTQPFRTARLHRHLVVKPFPVISVEHSKVADSSVCGADSLPGAQHPKSINTISLYFFATFPDSLNFPVMMKGGSILSAALSPANLLLPMKSAASSFFHNPPHYLKRYQSLQYKNTTLPPTHLPKC